MGNAGSLTIFLKKCHNPNNFKLIVSISISYFNNINIYQTNDIYIKKYDHIDNEPVAKPIDILCISPNQLNRIYLYHIIKQSLAEELQSDNIYNKLDILYHKIKSKYVHPIILDSFVKYFSKLLGHYYDSHNSKQQIDSFIKEYNIDMSIITAEEKKKWKCFNDFFSRNIDLKFRPLENKISTLSIVCPTDCRTICFSNNIDMQHYAKNSKFNFRHVTEILGDKNMLKSGSGIICRLAPEDYHHFHSPMDGEINSIHIPNSKPIIAQKNQINILNDNMKIMLHITNKMGLECHYLIIGTSLIGSIKFHSCKMARIYQYMLEHHKCAHTFMRPVPITIGEDLGTFLYGGSTVAMIFNKQIKFRDEITRYSLYDGPSKNKSLSEPIESYCYVRSYLGSVDK